MGRKKIYTGFLNRFRGNHQLAHFYYDFTAEINIVNGPLLFKATIRGRIETICLLSEAESSLVCDFFLLYSGV